MLFYNSGNLKHMVEMDMEHVIFFPQIGFGRILFVDDETTLFEKLGKSAKIETYYYDNTEFGDYVKTYVYSSESGDIHFKFHYENYTYTYLSIHTDILVFQGVNFQQGSIGMILETIKQYYDENNIINDWLYEEDSVIDEKHYEFNELGLSVWFIENKVSDICIWKSLEEE